MVRTSNTYSLVLPWLNTEIIKAQTIRRIESILKEGLATIEEGVEEAGTPTPSPAAAAVAAAAALSGGQLQRRMSLQKRTVSAKLQKKKQKGKKKGRWEVRISRFSTVISAPLSSLGDSYVRLMNGIADRAAGYNVGELAAFNAADAAEANPYHRPRSISDPYRPRARN